MSLSIIVPWFDSGDPARRSSWDWLRGRYEALLPDAELMWNGTSGSWDPVNGTILDDPFNRAAARNFLVEESTGSDLLIADADTVFDVAQIEAGLALLDDGAPWVIPYAEGRYFNLTEAKSKRVKAQPVDDTISEPTDPADWNHKITSWAGMLLVPRPAFEAAGGYNERFKGWGYEDNAFRAALDHTVGRHERVDGYALHLWHPAREEDCFSQPDIAANRALFRQYEAGLLP